MWNSDKIKSSVVNNIDQADTQMVKVDQKSILADWPLLSCGAFCAVETKQSG